MHKTLGFNFDRIFDPKKDKHFWPAFVFDRGISTQQTFTVQSEK